MDIKTLQYLENKVKRGKTIQKSIEILNGYIGRIDKTTTIRFNDDGTGDRLATIEGRYGEVNASIVAELIKAFKEIAEKEIERLKTEFEEL